MSAPCGTEAGVSAMRSRIAAALRAAGERNETARLAMLRLIDATIADKDREARSAGGRPDGVSDDDIQSVLDRMIQHRQESVVGYEEQGRFELADAERAEIEVLLELLPKKMDSDEIASAIDKVVRETKARGIRDKGRVMGRLKEEYRGRMDFRKVGGMVVDRLQ